MQTVFVWMNVGFDFYLLVGEEVGFVGFCLLCPIFLLLLFQNKIPCFLFLGLILSLLVTSGIAFCRVLFSHVLICNNWFLLSYLDYDEFGRDEFSFDNRPNSNGVDREGPVLSKLGSSSTTELHPKTAHGEPKATAMPPASVMTRLILIMVWRKLIRNPNTYSSLIGLTWSLVSYK